MKRILAIEIKRAFTSKGMIISFAFCMAIAMHQFIMYPQVGNNNSMFDTLVAQDRAGMSLPDYLWGAWIGGDAYLFHGYLYFLIIPILAALPFGSSYLQDTKGGYVKNVFTRTPRWKYYLSKWIATFLSGGCVVIVPLILNFLLMTTIYSSMGPYPETFHTLIVSTSMLADLFYTNPFQYVFLYFVMIFVFSGLFATMSLLVTCLSDYSFIVLLLPFLAILLASMILNLFGCDFLSPQQFLNPSYGKGAPLVIAIEAAVFFALSFAPFFLRGVRGKDF